MDAQAGLRLCCLQTRNENRFSLIEAHFIVISMLAHNYVSCADPEGGTGGPDPPPPPLKNHKNIGFLGNSSPDSLKNYKATEPAFNVVPSSEASEMPFKRGFAGNDDDRLIVLFGSTNTPHHLKRKKKCCQSWTLSDKIFWIRMCVFLHFSKILHYIQV